MAKKHGAPTTLASMSHPILVSHVNPASFRLDDIELRPLESSLLSFRADSGKLRSAIHEFGRIDSRGLHLESVFAHPGEASSPSLPHAFEDYGDAEHHVLYKSLEEIKREHYDDGSVSCVCKARVGALWRGSIKPDRV